MAREFLWMATATCPFFWFSLLVFLFAPFWTHATKHKRKNQMNQQTRNKYRKKNCKRMMKYIRLSYDLKFLAMGQLMVLVVFRTEPKRCDQNKRISRSKNCIPFQMRREGGRLRKGFDYTNTNSTLSCLSFTLCHWLIHVPLIRSQVLCTFLACSHDASKE